MTPRWPLTPHLLRSYVWLYPRIIVSKSHENTSKYVDTLTLFVKKTWTKGHWPLDDLWPHICWGHTCDSTQGSLCPSPMGIHQCMLIQWSILQKLPHTYTYILHTTYYAQNQWSHSLFLNYVQARQKGVIGWQIRKKGVTGCEIAQSPVYFKSKKKNKSSLCNQTYMCSWNKGGLKLFLFQEYGPMWCSTSKGETLRPWAFLNN